MKSSGGKDERWEEGECTLHRWPKLWEICGCTRPFSEFKRHLAIWLIVECNIENEDGILQGKGNHCSKLKKGKLKTKKLLKITILKMNISTQYNQQTGRQNQNSASLTLRKYVFTKTWWKVWAITASIWKWIVSSMLERIPQVIISESSHITLSDASFCKKCLYVYIHAA